MPADDPTDQGQRAGPPGERHVGAFVIVVLLVVVTGLAAIALYGLWTWWPSEGKKVPAFVYLRHEDEPTAPRYAERLAELLRHTP